MTDYDKLDSRMTIEIRSVQLAHPPMLTDVLARLASYYDTCPEATITVNAPDKDGTLMYFMHIKYRTGGAIMIGAMRRSIDAETEFHS